MQVWKQLQQHLPGNRREQQGARQSSTLPTSSKSSSVRISDSAERRTSASTFYVAVSDDSYDDSATSVMGSETNEQRCAVDRNSDDGQSQNQVNSPASDRTGNRKPPSGDVLKPTVLPKPNKLKVPSLQQQQQLELANGASVLTGGLVMSCRGTLYPLRYAPPVTQREQETTASVVKPLLPVCF